ncbi:MAG: helix-hairpin-helix domain-containing protein [Acidimicrobiia bacterium]
MGRKVLKLLGIIGGIAALAWAMRDRLISVATSREPELPSLRDTARVIHPPVDVLSGIGKVYADRLAKAGIGDVGALAAATPDSVAEAAGISSARARDWIDQANQHG